MNVIYLMSLILFIVYVVVGFFICRSDVRKGIIPKKYTITTIYIATLVWFVIYRFSYQFYLYFLVLVLIYLLFDLIQHTTKNTQVKGVFQTGDVHFYMMSFAVFPFYVINSFGIFGFPIVSIFCLSVIFMFGMVLVKLGFLAIEDNLPPLLDSYNTTVKTTSIRFAPVIYISYIIIFLLHIL